MASNNRHDIDAIIRAMEGNHYYLRDADKLLVRSMLNERRPGIHAALLQGPPGVGKTFFAKTLARSVPNAKYFDYQFHSWSTNEDLFAGVHVGRLAVGVKAPADAIRKGVLWLAAESSLQHFTVLLLDEIDKAPERSEHLLLQFLQDGIVQDTDIVEGFGKVKADPNNLVVIITTNMTRDLHEATMRRVFRHNMQFLTPAKESKLLRVMTGAPDNMRNAVVAAANVIRDKATSSPSTQEIANLLSDCIYQARDASDCLVLIKSWLVKSPADMDPNSLANLSATLWGEVNALRNRSK